VLLQGWAPTFTALLMFRFLFVIVAVSRMQAEVLLIHQWFSRKQIGTVLGISTGVMVIGQMIAVGLTPYLLITLAGWRNVYYVVGIIMIATASLWMIIGRERPQSKPVETGTDRRQSPIHVLKTHKFLWILAAAPSGAALAFSAMMTFWPTLALETLPLSLTEIGTLMTVFLLGGIVAAFAAAPLSSYFRRRKPFLWVAGILLPPLYIALFTTNSVIIAGILLFLSGFNAQIWVPIIRTIPFDLRLEPRETAIATGLGMTLLPIVGAMGPPLVGVIQEITGSLQIGLLAIVAFPLTLLIGGLLIPETSPNRIAQD
jgi:sugar phosphate permease